MALVFGTAGLPHILVRFYTVPDAKTARVSVVWAMVLIGSFYIMTTFLGFGAATIVGRDHIASHGGNNMSAPLLAQALAGDIFFAFIAAIAFATILAVVAGLTISASTSFAHDFYTSVIHKGVERAPGEEVRVARITAFVVGAVAIGIAILLGKDANVAFLVALAFAVAASANLAGHRAFAFLEAIQHHRRRRRAGRRARRFARSDHDQSQHHESRSADCRRVRRAISFNARRFFRWRIPAFSAFRLVFSGRFSELFCAASRRPKTRFAELIVRANTGLGRGKSVDRLSLGSFA